MNNPRNNLKTYNKRGAEATESGQFQQAIEDYTEAISLDPKDADAYYNRGSAYSSWWNRRLP